MSKKILSIVKLAEEYLSKADHSNSAEVLKYLERWIGYFQHERLIHLIVTVCFAVMSMLSVILFFISCEIIAIVILMLFLITTMFYVKHYYLLENKTQYLYELYDKILEKTLE